MKKRVAAILLTVTMTASALAGCSGAGQEKETQASETQDTASAGAEDSGESQSSGDKSGESRNGSENSGESQDGKEKSGTSDTEDAKSETAEKPFEGQTITWVSQGVGDNAWEGQTKPLIEKFQEETGATVKTEWYSFNDLFEVIEVKVGSGSSDYDVLSVDVPMVAGYADRGYLAPMDEYFTEEEKGQFIDSAVTAGTWDGKFYAPAMNTSSQLLWYNKALLQQAGIEMPESDTEKRLTWEQIEKMAKDTLAAVDPDGNNGIAGLMFQQVSRTYQMNPLANSLGGKNIGDDGYGVEGVINDESWVKACTWYQNLYNEGVSLRGITADEVTDTFTAGKVVFMVGGTWTEANCAQKDFQDYGYCPLPAFEGHEDQVGTSTGSWHFGIPANSQNKDLAAYFIKWLSIGEGNDMWLDINHDVPSTKAAVDAILNDENADGIMKIAAYEAANTAVPRALTPGYTEYDTVITNTWEDIRNGTEVKTALDNAVSQINTAMEKYQK